MMSRDLREDWHTRLEQLREEAPEFLDFARIVLREWKPGEANLMTVMAAGLREAYRMGLEKEPVRPQPLLDEEEGVYSNLLRRTHPVVTTKPAPGPIRRTRIAREEEPPQPPPNRIRRTR
jgi:hypothetical protein